MKWIVNTKASLLQTIWLQIVTGFVMSITKFFSVDPYVYMYECTSDWVYLLEFCGWVFAWGRVVSRKYKSTHPLVVLPL